MLRVRPVTTAGCDPTARLRPRPISARPWTESRVVARRIAPDGGRLDELASLEDAKSRARHFGTRLELEGRLKDRAGAVEYGLRRLDPGRPKCTFSLPVLRAVWICPVSGGWVVLDADPRPPRARLKAQLEPGVVRCEYVKPKTSRTRRRRRR